MDMDKWMDDSADPTSWLSHTTWDSDDEDLIFQLEGPPDDDSDIPDWPCDDPTTDSQPWKTVSRPLIIEDEPYSPWMKWGYLVPYTHLECEGAGSSKPSVSGSSSTGNEGSITYNIYQNQYQNSMDLSGSSTNQGGASAASPASTISSILSSTSNLVGSLLPIALADQDTEETTLLSDRLSKTVKGVTAVNSQSSVGVARYYRSNKPEEPTSCADKSTMPAPSTERFFSFQLKPWTSTQTCFQYLAYPLPKYLLQQDSVFTEMALRHYCFKSGWRVIVQCNASAFHQGCLLAMLAPEWTCDSGNVVPDWKTPNSSSFDASYCNPFQWPVYPHQFLNLRTGTSVEIEVPYVNLVPTSFHATHNPWTLVVAVIVPLTYSEGSAPNIEISVSIAPCAPIFNGIRHRLPATEGPIPTHIRETQGNWISTLPDTTTPVYGKCYKPPDHHMTGEITDLVQLAQIPTFLTTSQNVCYFTVSNAINGTPLYTFEVGLNSTNIVNSMIGGLAKNFTQYRGSLEIDMMFCGSALTRGKFLLCYTPPGAGAPISLEQATQATYIIWDLGLQSTYKFTVPYISSSDFRYSQGSTDTELTVSGYFTIFQFTPLTYPAGVPNSSSLVVMVSAGSDFCFRNPVMIPFTQGTDNAESGAVESTSAPDDFDAKNVSIPSSHSNIQFFFDRSVYYSLLYATRADFTTPGISPSAPNAGFYWALLSPLPTSATSQVFGTSGNLTNTYTRFCIPFLRCMPFTYYKCDLEITVLLNYAWTNTFTTGCEAYVHWYPVGAGLPTASIIYPTSAVMKQSTIMTGRHTIIRAPTNGAISFTVPYTSPLAALPTRYNGTSAFSQGVYGCAPGAHFGVLAIQIGSFQTGTNTNPTTSGLPAFKLFLRFKNMRTYIPQPISWFDASAVDYTPMTTNLVASVSTTEKLVVDEAHDVIATAYDTSKVEIDLPDQLVLETQSCFPHPHVQVKFGPFNCSVFETVCYKRCALGDVALLLRVKYRHYHLGFFHLRLLLSGDVELNPGPKAKAKTVKFDIPELVAKCMAEEGCLDSNLKEELTQFLKGLPQDIHLPSPCPKKVDKSKLSSAERKDVAFMKLLESEDPATTIVAAWQTLSDMQDMYKRVKEAAGSAKVWLKALLCVVKALAAFAIYKHSPDMTTALLLTLMGAVDMFNFDGIYDYFERKLGKCFKTPPPERPKSKFCSLFTTEGPFDNIRNANGVFQLMKNSDWLIKWLFQAVQWIRSWFTKELESDESKLAELLPDFHDMASRSLAALASGCEDQQAQEYMDKVHKLATSCGKVQVANMACKYRRSSRTNRSRTEPVVVVLRGAPGTGKSVCCQILAETVSKILSGSKSTYSCPPDSDFFDGYTGQYSVILDDLAQNPNGQDFRSFCQMVSCTQYFPNMAALEDKGRPFTSKFIVASTNMGRFLPVTVAEPAAIQRRIYKDLTIQVDPDFQWKKKLDLTAALTPDGPGNGIFRHHVPLFDTAVSFYDAAKKKCYTLMDLVEKVVNKLRKKDDVNNALATLICESPSPSTSCCVPVSVADKDFEKLRCELMEAHAETQRMAQLFYKAAGVIMAVMAAVTLYKTCKSDPAPQKPQLIAVPSQSRILETTRDAESAYDMVAKKRATRVLEMEAPPVLEMQNPVADLEIHLAQYTVHSIGFLKPDSVQPLYQSCVSVRDHFFVVNLHTWNEDWTSFLLGDRHYYREDVTYTAFKRKGVDLDVVLVKLPNSAPKFKDSLKHFVTGSADAPLVGSEVVGISKLSGIGMTYTGTYQAHPNVVVTNQGPFNAGFLYKAPTRKGYCGSALVAKVGNSRKIIGIHTAGASGVGCGTLVYKELLEKGMAHLSLECEGAFSRKPDGPMVFVPRKSALFPTVAKYAFDMDCGPAPLSNKDKRLDDGVKLDEQVFSKHTGNTSVLPEEFRQMIEDYANEIFTLVGTDNGMLTFEEAISGIPGLDPMDPNTSPGLPYTLRNQRRTDLVNFDNQQPIDKDFALSYNRMIQGDFSEHEFQTFLKDEIRPGPKVRAGGTRVVDVAALEHCIIGRQLFGKFAAKIQSLPGHSTGSAIGCNPDVDWTKFAQQCNKFTYTYDIDYKAFDSSHGTAMFDLFSRHFFTTANGFNPLCAAYLQSLAISQHAFSNMRYTLEGGLPSGCSATSLINTMFNNVIIRAGLKMTYPNFKFEDVRVIAYGDDLLVSTNHILDFSAVSLNLVKCGYTITPASKTGIFPLKSTLYDCTFLKRAFEPFDSYQFIHRPVMSDDNIKMILSYYRPGTLREKLESVALLAVHSGRVKYDHFFKPFRQAGFLVPSWASLQREWEQNFY